MIFYRLPKTIEDDRGEQRPFLLERALRTVEADAVRPVGRALAMVTTPTLSWAHLAIVPAIVWFVWISLRQTGSDPAATMLPVGIVVSLVWSWWAQRRRSARVASLRRDTLVKWMASGAKCPCCAAGLSATDGHALTPCGACGAAWRTERIGNGWKGMAALSATRARSVRGFWGARIGGNGAVGVDNRGTPCVLARAARQLRPDRFDDDSFLARCDRADSRGDRWPRWLSVVVGAAAIALFIGKELTGSSAWLAPIVAVYGVAAVRDLWCWSSGRATRELRNGLCPSCAEDLTTVQPTPDGFIRCPLCESSWRAEVPA